MRVLNYLFYIAALLYAKWKWGRAASVHVTPQNPLYCRKIVVAEWHISRPEVNGLKGWTYTGNKPHGEGPTWRAAFRDAARKWR
jgi:hypothetical protein